MLTALALVRAGVGVSLVPGSVTAMGIAGLRVREVGVAALGPRSEAVIEPVSGAEAASTGPYGPGAPPLGRRDAEESAGCERFLSGSSASKPAPAGRLLSPPNGINAETPCHGGRG